MFLVLQIMKSKRFPKRSIQRENTRLIYDVIDKKKHIQVCFYKFLHVKTLKHFDLYNRNYVQYIIFFLLILARIIPISCQI